MYYGSHKSNAIASFRAWNLRNAKSVQRRARQYYVKLIGPSVDSSE